MTQHQRAHGAQHHKDTHLSSDRKDPSPASQTPIEYPTFLATMTPPEVLSLQRLIGNHAVVKALTTAAAASAAPPISTTSHATIQRQNGAVPQNFAVTGTVANNADVTIRTNKSWTSSTTLGDLSDVEMREVVTFNHNPDIDIPSYPLVVPTIPGMTLVGNVLTKVAGVMTSGSGSDNHSGAGYGPHFKVAGVPNLTMGAWTLVGTQVYEYRDRGALGPWTPLHGGNFTITRTMAMNPGTHQWELTFSKTGPFGVNVVAGPTPIEMTTTDAMADIQATRPDQAAIWTGIDNAITVDQEHQYNQIRTANKMITGTIPHSVVPVNFIITEPMPAQSIRNQPFAPYTVITAPEYTPVFANVESAIDDILAQFMGRMNAAPSRIDIILTKCGGQVRQQGIYTAAAGGVFRIVLRYDKFTNVSPADKDTTMAGTESKKGWKQKTKIKNWEQATIIHEMGHLLHAFTSIDKFQSATVDMMTAQTLHGTNPVIEAQLFHVARINEQIMNALRAKRYARKWTYAKDNPAEIVAEIWTALLKGTTVPRGLAAVYLAYGGMRDATIDNRLRRRFPHNQIPAFNQPEDAIPYI